VVIRPLAYVKEADLEAYADWRAFPIIPCTLCGSQENLKRAEAKRMLRDWERRHPGRVDSVFSALTRVVPSHLMDRELFDFAGLAPTGVPDADGDIAFDVDPVFEAPPPTVSAAIDAGAIPIRRRAADDAVATAVPSTTEDPR
jgi:tRNA 2-thiocytidine biosynthesis protein TtcA